jgi:hypothetical protein
MMQGARLIRRTSKAYKEDVKELIRRASHGWSTRFVP